MSLPLPPLSPDAFSLIPSIEIDNLEFAKQHGSKYQAVRSFIQAKQAYEYRNDPARAEALLSRAIELDPSNRNLRFMRAFLQLKQSGKTAAALSGFQSLSASPWDRPAMLSAYFEARIHADQGRGRRARHILDGMLLGAELDPLLEKAVRDLRGRLNWLPVVPFPTAPLTLLMQQADLPSY